MNFLRSLAANIALVASGDNGPIGNENIENIAKSGFNTFKDIIDIVIPIILGVVLLVGTIYAIILGVNYSKAEDADERKKAKERLVGAVVGFLIALVLIAVIYAVLRADFMAKLFNK